MKKHSISIFKIPPISGVIIAIVAIFSIVLASCSKDEILSDTHPEVSITVQQGDTPAVSYYAITDSTGIGFTSQGYSVYSLAAGSSVLNLNKEIVGKVVLKYPHSLSEQTAIATILSDCDKEISSLEEKMNLKSGGFSIREMKTRWGSCNQRTHKLLFNLELAKKPQPCIEYVVVHELAHIVSKNHDTQFKAVLDKHLPLWEKYKNELNEFII